jgi:hypothetical protein
LYRGGSGRSGPCPAAAPAGLLTGPPDRAARPGRLTGSLTPAEIETLLRSSRRAIRTAIAEGGVHALTIIPFRREGARCPRDHGEMVHAVVGGRTT